MHIKTMADLKEAYGTWARVADRLDMSPQALNNAKNQRGVLPKDKHFIQMGYIEADGHTASRSLWGFAEPAEPEAAE